MNRTVSDSTPVLVARGLEKRYRHGHEVLEVLRGLDLEVTRGMLLAIVGASGSGKSTLLNILGTLDRPDAGTVELEGRRLEGLSAPELARIRARRIGFVFQFHHLLPEFSAEENVMMPLLMTGQSTLEARARARELLGVLSLSGWRDHRPAELSGGEAQRVAVARALAASPDLVLADEPSGNLDSQTAQELHQLLTTLCRERHQTFVIATHNERLASAADRVLKLEAGRLRPME
ncbi:MAG TPA: ABC transporter ATP-binding protein [Candidatus Sulfotelmatobacter sp.]|nr:ABC transporter ATP-binding protein [Candidatus Sulfotelmatobacter sp.]